MQNGWQRSDAGYTMLAKISNLLGLENFSMVGLLLAVLLIASVILLSSSIVAFVYVAMITGLPLSDAVRGAVINPDSEFPRISEPYLKGVVVSSGGMIANICAAAIPGLLILLGLLPSFDSPAVRALLVFMTLASGVIGVLTGLFVQVRQAENMLLRSLAPGTRLHTKLPLVILATSLLMVVSSIFGWFSLFKHGNKWSGLRPSTVENNAIPEVGAVSQPQASPLPSPVRPASSNTSEPTLSLSYPKSLSSADANDESSGPFSDAEKKILPLLTGQGKNLSHSPARKTTRAMTDPTAKIVPNDPIEPDPTVRNEPMTTNLPMRGERFPETRLHVLTLDELSTFDREELRYAINELFARRGGVFSDKDLDMVFSTKPWYRPRNDMDFDEIEKEFTSIEKTNLHALAKRRAQLGTASVPKPKEKIPPQRTTPKRERGIDLDRY